MTAELLNEIDALGGSLEGLDVLSTEELLALVEELQLEGDDGFVAAPNPATDMFIQQLPALARKYSAAAAMVTAVWYNGLEPQLPYQAQPVFDLPDEQVAKTAHWAMFAPGDEDPVTRVSTSMQRWTYDASRDTILANAREEKAKVVRYAQANACPWCQVLATRGAVYRSEETAMAGSHDRCRCMPLVIRPGGFYNPPPWIQEYEQNYADAVKGLEQFGITPAGQYAKGEDFLDDVVNYMRRGGGPPRGWTPEVEPVVPKPKPRPKPTPAKRRPPPAPPKPPAPPLRGTVADKFDLSATPWVDGTAKVNPGRADGLAQLDRAKTIGGVRKAANSLYPDMRWGLNQESDLEMAKGVVRAVDHVRAKYPTVELRSMIMQTGMKSNVYADCEMDTHQMGLRRSPYGPQIRLNAKWAKEPGNFRGSWNRTVRQRYHYNGTTNPAFDTIMHELGHAVHENVARRGNKVSGDTIDRALEDFYMRQIEPKAAARPARSMMDNAVSRFSEWRNKNLSGYSGSSTLEAMAEAFADVEINGRDAHDSSKVLHRVLIDALNAPEQDKFWRSYKYKEPSDWQITTSDEAIDMSRSNFTGSTEAPTAAAERLTRNWGR